MSVSDVPPLHEYVADKEVLGFDFTYPSEYLRSIEWDQKATSAGGDGLQLSFLLASEIRKDLASVHKATSKRLVPFARGYNGDWLCCFDAQDSRVVYIIDLGAKRLHAVRQPEVGYAEFLNAYLSNLDLPAWYPSS